MKQMIQAFLCLTFIVSACNNTVPADSNLVSSKDESNELNGMEVQPAKEEVGNQKIANDISIATSGGVELNRTFLSYESDEPVPSSNTTSVGKAIYLNLVLSKGWKEEMGEVSIGASQKISTDDGTVVLDNADLFDNYKSISAEDAKYIKIKAVVNKLTPNIKYFIVDYKVWDKNGSGMIKGSYRFYVNK
ncbi:MAG: hypothetical protein ACXVBX_08710 [Flavisolibacter sp.]